MRIEIIGPQELQDAATEEEAAEVPVEDQNTKLETLRNDLDYNNYCLKCKYIPYYWHLLLALVSVTKLHRQGVICSGLQQFVVYLRFVMTGQNNYLVGGGGNFFLSAAPNICQPRNP